MNQWHFTQIGGARLDFFNATWPFARLSGNSDAILLGCLGRKYFFPKTKIVRLRRYRGILSTGLQIEHTERSFPGFVVFWASVFSWSCGFKRLKSSLEDLGYEV